jgi:hypothetical protein
MINKLFLLFVFSLSFGNIFAQDLIPFYDREKQLWGFQNKETKQIIVQPQFEYASEWWNEYGIVIINRKFGLVDINGKIVAPFIHEKIYVEKCKDCPLKNSLVAVYYYYNYKPSMNSNRIFKIDENCNCIPQPYFPCPPTVPLDTSSTPKNLKLLQKAEYLYHQGEIKMAFEIAEKAIESDTNDASTYFWKATHLGYTHDLRIMENPESQITFLNSLKNNWDLENIEIEKILQKRKASTQSDQLSEEEFKIEMNKLAEEKKIFDEDHFKKIKSLDSLKIFQNKWEEQSLDFINTKFDTSYRLNKYYNSVLQKTKIKDVYHSTLAAKYELNYISKNEKKEIKKEIKKEVPRFERKSTEGLILHPAFGFFPYPRLEMNITYGFSDFVFKNGMSGLFGVGIGYDNDLSSSLETLKLTFMNQPFGVIHIALNLLAVRNDEFSNVGFRPEFGLSFSAFTILYGYNFISKSKFGEARGNMVGVRLNLPIWRKNQFRKDLGNNLYRN